MKSWHIGLASFLTLFIPAALILLLSFGKSDEIYRTQASLGYLLLLESSIPFILTIAMYDDRRSKIASALSCALGLVSLTLWLYTMAVGLNLMKYAAGLQDYLIFQNIGFIMGVSLSASFFLLLSAVPHLTKTE